jgi:Raf kinase inhibitor-like YbhB/YbcL family protein
MSQISGGRRLALSLVVTIILAACDTGDGRTLDPPVFAPPDATTPQTTVPDITLPAEAPVAQLQLVAPWPNGAALPSEYTCDDADVAPALTWANVPPGTTELAVTVTDLDADGFVHWILFAIDPTRTGLPAGEVPDGVFQWPNSFGNPGWDGPCPPPGIEHRYVFTIHALNQQLEVADDASAQEVVATLNFTTIEQSSVSATYSRTG